VVERVRAHPLAKKTSIQVIGCLFVVEGERGEGEAGTGEHVRDLEQLNTKRIARATTNHSW